MSFMIHLEDEYSTILKAQLLLNNIEDQCGLRSWIMISIVYYTSKRPFGGWGDTQASERLSPACAELHGCIFQLTCMAPY